MDHVTLTSYKGETVWNFFSKREVISCLVADLQVSWKAGKRSNYSPRITSRDILSGKTRKAPTYSSFVLALTEREFAYFVKKLIKSIK